MSRRPQEPPRSVSRHHRPTSLKTSGIADQLFKLRRRCQKIRRARGFVPTNQEFTNSPFCAAGAPHAFTHKDSQIDGTAPGLRRGDDEIRPCTHKSLMSVMPRDSDRKADIA
jgi:hypothetical protein